MYVCIGMSLSPAVLLPFLLLLMFFVHIFTVQLGIYDAVSNIVAESYKNGSLYSFLLQSTHETSENIITQSKIALPKPLGFHTAEEVKAYDTGHNRCVYCVG